MLRSKTILVLVLTVSLVMGMFSFGFAAQKEFVAIATGGTGGTYYPLGGALAQLLSNYVEGLIVTAQTGNASIANCNLIGRGQIETAFSQANTTYWSYTATGILKDAQPITNLRGIASLYPETIHIIATKASGIKTVEDLRGKKVGVGAPNSGTAADAEIILNAHGLTFDDIKPDFLSFAEVAQRLIDGQIDAGFTTAGYPTSSVINIATKRDIVLVPISEEKMKELVEKIPYYGATVIPAGIYKGVDEPVPALATPALWICDAKLSPSLVYKMTKALWEHRDVLEKVHAKGKDITLETALDGMGIPLHPGAELYYKEVGLIK
ncbi:MAG TPA: C4-dicarboxylate ABC transporter substrate-binding protein [Candidatus Atribacteria bacterium]|nr:C4-dicarboxylate ABC transporter substrate-binding protein [Candidatus Atribacteria bacterium]